MAEPSETGATDGEAVEDPVVICDDVHVEYNTLATGKKATATSMGGLLNRGRSLQTVHALKGVSFVANANESIGIIGTNGSGKSTLMRTITGLTPATRGAVYAKSRPNLLGIGAALLNDLSGSRNIILGGLALGMSRQEIEAKYDDIVEFTGLRDFIDMPMRTYSSGMTARLKFGIATAWATVSSRSGRRSASVRSARPQEPCSSSRTPCARSRTRATGRSGSRRASCAPTVRRTRS
jgi:teichoic acid transport system ATP-binding protein